MVRLTRLPQGILKVRGGSVPAVTTIAPHGLHHVTAIADRPAAQRRLLHPRAGAAAGQADGQLRRPGHLPPLLRRRAGHPVQLLTFFPWPGVPPGRQGAGMTTATAFSVPPESLGWWHAAAAGPGRRRRRAAHPRRRGGADPARPGRHGHRPGRRAGRPPLRLGRRRATSRPSTPSAACTRSPCPSGSSTRPPRCSPTARHERRRRGRRPPASPWRTGHAGALVDVRRRRRRDRGLQAGGTVHHVAFRAPDLETHDALAAGAARRAGVAVTQILDRQYFKSIYFREPGGVLFEIATDQPGFDVDEPLLELGRHLQAAAVAGARPRADRGRAARPRPAGLTHPLHVRELLGHPAGRHRSTSTPRT